MQTASRGAASAAATPTTSAGSGSQADRDRLLRSYARRIDPSDAGAHNNLGVLYYNSGLLEEAVAAFRHALELEPRMEAARRNFEIAWLNCGHAERRVRELREHLRANPTDRDARWEVGRTSALLDEHAEAIPHFAHILDADPTDLGALIQIALSSKAIDALDNARQYFERALALDPDSSLVYFYLAEVEYSRGLNDRAIELLRAAIQRNSNNHEAWYLLGFVLGDAGRHDEARDAARRAVELNPELSRAQANLVLSDESTARYVDKAHRETARRQQLDVAAEAPLTHLNLGVAFRRRGYFAEALAEYQLALQRGEDADLVRQAMAEAHLLRREPELALDHYDHLLECHPENPRLWNERGVALHQSGRHAEARECYQYALSLSAGDAVALNNIGVALAHEGDIDGAMAAFGRVLDADPAFGRARLNLGLLLYKGRRLQQAAETFRAALQLGDEVKCVAWNGIGLVLSDLRQFEDARNAFARAIQLRPRYAEAHYNLSFALSSLGDFEGALRENRLALEIAPYYVTQKLQLALDLQFDDPEVSVDADLAAEHRTDEAIENFAFDATVMDTLFTELSQSVTPTGESGETDPFAMAADYLSKGMFGRAHAEVVRAMNRGADAVRGGTLLGDTFARQQLWGEALERYREVLDRAPDDLPAMSGAATALLRLGSVDDARSMADAVVARAPNDADALLLAAAARDAGGDHAGARELLEVALRVAPMRVDVLKFLGDVARRAADLDAAVACYRNALAIDDGYASVRLELARVHAERDESDDAERELLAAIDSVPSYADAIVELARLRLRLERGADALPPLIELLERDSYHFDALMVLGDALFQMGNRDDAAIAYGRVLRFDPSHVPAQQALASLRERRAVALAGVA
ncbi:MAG TPA: tetratricopeptide repeat protein [Gemmatimonadaceae bacterium]|nr:tetratricopeptide repeat protein [Gemmatimonadaceae bacterium]